MGITLAVFRIAGKTPVGNKLQIVAQWFDIWSEEWFEEGDLSWNTVRPTRFIAIER